MLGAAILGKRTRCPGPGPPKPKFQGVGFRNFRSAETPQSELQHTTDHSPQSSLRNMRRSSGYRKPIADSRRE